MDNLPDKIIKILADHNSHVNDIVVWMLCDRGIDGGYIDTYLVLTNSSLLIISNKEDAALSKTFKGYLMPKKPNKNSKMPPEKVVKDWFVETIAMTDITDVSIVNLVASGMVVIKGNEIEARVIAAFTNGYMTMATK